VDRPQILAEADHCVKCGLCLPHCPTYLLTRDEGDSPRGRIALIQAMAAGQLDSDRARFHLDRCLLCRACETACPSGVKYGKLLDANRASQKRGNSTTKWIASLPYKTWTAPLLRFYQTSGLRKLARTMGSSEFKRSDSLLPRLPEESPGETVQPKPEPTRGRVGLFTGCIGRITDQPALTATTRLLNHLGIEVVIPREQVCCGAMFQHEGDPALAADLLETNRNVFSDPDLDAIIFVATGCGMQLVELGSFSPPVIEIGRYLHERELLRGQRFSPSSDRIALHLPCSQKYVLKDEVSTNMLLQLIPGIQIETIRHKHCCGAAGRYMLEQPELSDRLRTPILEEIEQRPAHFLATTNTGCAMHLRAGLEGVSSATKVVHPVELLDKHLIR
jgi:glycolate oxidase iron-sulfur subunit